MSNNQTARTWAQRARKDAYYPDTMSHQARSLIELRAQWLFWQRPPAELRRCAAAIEWHQGIALELVRHEAGRIIAAGCSA